jgi:hypothetical protein
VTIKTLHEKSSEAVSGKLDSFEAGMRFGFQRAMNPDDCALIEDGIVSHEAFERGMEAGPLAAFYKRNHLVLQRGVQCLSKP